VPVAPTPITSGTRPATILTTSSAKRLRSSAVRCEASPVLPTKGRDAAHPGLYKAFDHRLGGREIQLPRSSKGVTIAGMSSSNILNLLLRIEYSKLSIPDPAFSSPTDGRMGSRVLNTAI
jgi:hypothetical protein